MNRHLTVIYISVKRVFPSHCRFAPLRTHDETLQAANQVEYGECSEVRGIIGKSPFFQAENFNHIEDIVPEPMHLLDGGFTKNIAGSAFNCGVSQQSEAGYRRTSVAVLTKKIE